MKRQPVILAVLAASILAGCQSYQRWDLDPESARREWRGRDVMAPDVKEFAAELAKLEASPRVYNPADGVDLAEAEVICLFFNPDLRAKRLEADVALAGARAAGEWDNPELDLSVGRVLESVANPWVLAASISFTIPLSGRPGIERDLAFAQHRVQWRQVLADEWTTVAHLRELWRQHAATLRSIELLQAHVDSLTIAGGRADKLVKAGELHATDGRLLAIEKAQAAAELAEARRLADIQAREIKAWLGLTPQAQIKFNVALQTTATIQETVARENSPTVAVRREAYQVAEQQLRLEIQKQYPDLRIGPGFELDDGQSKIMLGFGIPIPIINLNRRGIAEAAASRKAARAAYDAACLRLYADIDLAQSRLISARALRSELERELAPLVDKQVEDINKRAELGEFDALLMLEGLKSNLEAKQRILQAALDEAHAADALSVLAGPNWKKEAPKEK